MLCEEGEEEEEEECGDFRFGAIHASNKSII
jgi:hypothetical protein